MKGGNEMAGPAAPAAAPLSAHHRIASRDIGELHDAVEPLAVGHDLISRDPGKPLDGIVNGLTLESIGLVWVRYGGGGVIVDTPPTEGEFALCAPSAPMGVEYRRSGRRGVATGSLVLSHDEPMRMTPDPQRGCLVISTTTGRLGDHLRGYLGHVPRRPLRFHTDGGPGLADSSVIDGTWRYVCALLDRTAAEGIHPMAARSLEQSLLTAVLVGLPHTATAELASYEPPRHDTAGHIREWLEAHHDDCVGVADLAAAMNLSIRQVQAICRQHWNQTPMQLLRGIRLDHARTTLMSAEPTKKAIAQAAAAAGFARVSRFTAAYRERFGEPPAATLTRAAGVPLPRMAGAGRRGRRRP